VLSKVALVTKSKVAVAVLGVLLAGTGGTVALAATGHMPSLPNVAQGANNNANGNNDNGNHGHTVAIEGTLKAYNAGAKSVSVVSVGSSASTVITVNAQTRVTGENASKLSDLASAIGHKVQVQATKESNGSLVAWKITVEGATGDNSQGNNTRREIAGTITSVNADGFVIKTATGDSVTIVVNAQTSITGAASALGGIKVGMRVQVHGTSQKNGTLLADAIQVENGSDSGHSGDSGSGH
jgi:hypothetical protein